MKEKVNVQSEGKEINGYAVRVNISAYCRCVR